MPKKAPEKIQKIQKKAGPKTGGERGREVSMRKLLQAGVEIFSEVGFNGATTRMLSQRSGVNESLINRYFNGKSGLFLAVIMDFICKNKGNELNYPRGETLEQEIENYLKFHTDQAIEHRDFMRIILSRVATDSEIRNQVTQCIESMVEENCSSIVTRLREFQKKGEIRKDVDARLAARVIGMQEMGAKLLVTLMPEFDRKQSLIDIRIFAREFSRGLRP
jgi:TetR/AcrR family transcriptional regulator